MEIPFVLIRISYDASLRHKSRSILVNFLAKNGHFFCTLGQIWPKWEFSQKKRLCYIVTHIVPQLHAKFRENPWSSFRDWLHYKLTRHPSRLEPAFLQDIYRFFTAHFWHFLFVYFVYKSPNLKLVLTGQKLVFFKNLKKIHFFIYYIFSVQKGIANVKFTI